MDRLGLEEALENPETLSFDSLVFYVSPRSINDLTTIHQLLDENVEETAYCILVSGLYAPQREALRALALNIPRSSDKNRVKFDREFYEDLKRAHAEREANQKPHSIDLLFAEINKFQKQAIPRRRENYSHALASYTPTYIPEIGLWN